MDDTKIAISDNSKTISLAFEQINLLMTFTVYKSCSGFY